MNMPLCAQGCGRPAFLTFATCCVRCDGRADQGHNRDCAAKAAKTKGQSSTAQGKRARGDGDEDGHGTADDASIVHMVRQGSDIELSAKDIRLKGGAVKCDDDTEEDEPPPAAPTALPAPVAVGPPPVDGNGSGAADTSDPLGPLADLGSTTVQGSGASVYTIKRVGATYSCSCPAWRNQSGMGAMRTCKHLKGLRGDAAELERLGGSHTAFYKTGSNRVVGQDGGSGGGGGGGGAPSSMTSNDAIVRSVALAEAWDGAEPLVGWALSEKLDGMRCIWDPGQPGTGQGKLWTRTGKEIAAPPSLLACLPRDTALDGELWLGRGRFQELMSIVRRQDAPEGPWKDVEYVVFDAPRADGGLFDRIQVASAALTTCPPPLAADAAANAAGASSWVRLLEHERCGGLAHIQSRLSSVLASGGEGLVARHPTANHRGGRSHDVLKIKTFEDDEALVTGHEPGKGKHVGRLGALHCKLRDGTTFKVGTGFSDAEREDPPPLGSVVSVQYGELTRDGVPRFPSYKGRRLDVNADEFKA